MSRASLISRAVLTSAATALVLAGCSIGGASSEPLPGAGIEAPAAPAAPASPQASETPRAAPTAAPGGGAAAQPARPAPGQCVDIPEAADGVYTVFEAGTATVVREGNQLVLVSEQAAPGWTSRVDERGGEDVEIDFRRGNEELDLEVDLDDGRVEVEICNDQDD